MTGETHTFHRDYFTAECKKLGVEVKPFGTPVNARFFKSECYNALLLSGGCDIIVCCCCRRTVDCPLSELVAERANTRRWW